MLPRCARALETGYNVFSMDLILGHHLVARRESRIGRILKYANRGFGIRVLPSYARSLAEQSSSLESDPNRQSYAGLKLLQRIAWSGQAFVESLKRESDPRTADYDSLSIQRHEQLRAYNLYFRQEATARGACPPTVKMWELACEDYDRERQPVRSWGLSNFEVFTRFCAAWSLAQRGHIM